MSTQAELDALKQLLKQAQLRAEKAEKKALKAEKKIKQLEKQVERKQAASDELQNKLKDREQQVEEYECLIPKLMEFLILCKEHVIQLRNELPEIQQDFWDKLMENFSENWENLPEYRRFARFVLKGSEKTGRPKSPQQIKKTIADTDRSTRRSISTRSNKFGSVLSVTGRGSALAADKHPDNAALQASKKVADIELPVPEETENKPSPGRQRVKQFQDAPVHPVAAPTTCPDCGSKDYVLSDVREQAIRQMVGWLQNALEHGVLQQRNGRCFSCGKVHHYTSDGQSLPVAPGHTIDQRTAIGLGLMCTNGLALNRSQEIFINSQTEQLGHSTLNDNVHDWAMQTGSVLADRLNEHLKSQNAVVMDETTFTVLQSQGRGNCPLPENQKARQKDYLAVQTSGYGEDLPCVVYKYIGGRKKEDIEKALEGFNNDALVTDAYAAYDSYVRTKDGMEHQCCLVHLRRQFLDSLAIEGLNESLFESKDSNTIEKAIEKAAKGFEENQPAYYVLSCIQAFQKIYCLEKWLKRRADEPKDEWLARVREYRGTISTELMDSVDVIMNHLAKDFVEQGDNQVYKAKTSSLIGKAVAYYLNHRDNFRVFLTNPLVEPDSSSAERRIRAVTVLRKVCDFKQSAKYMDSMCVYFTLSETAKMYGFDFAMTMEWLQDFGRAYYLHRANATLTEEVNNRGRKLDSKLMSFSPESAKGFDVEPWLPWNYRARRTGEA
mgnify:CR=1 FL=1